MTGRKVNKSEKTPGDYDKLMIKNVKDNPDDKNGQNGSNWLSRLTRGRKKTPDDREKINEKNVKDNPGDKNEQNGNKHKKTKLKMKWPKIFQKGAKPSTSQCKVIKEYDWLEEQMQLPFLEKMKEPIFWKDKQAIDEEGSKLLCQWKDTILRQPALKDYIDVDQLGELQASQKIRQMLDVHLLYQLGLVERSMSVALKQEEKCWKEGRQPIMIRSICHSKLAVDILEICRSRIEESKQVSEVFANEMMPELLNTFQRFLNRYESSFTNYITNNKEKPHYEETIIANMNCSSHFRDFIEEVRAGKDTKKEIYLILSRIETQGVNILLQDLFPDIKSDFRAIHQKNGLNSQENMSQIIKTVNTYMSNVNTSDTPCHKVMAGKVHMHLVQEYLATIIAISPCNIDEQKALAAQMCNTADLLTNFCKDQLSNAQMSEATWMNNAIRKIATIIKLQDLEAIKQDVVALAHEYPDIKKQHVKSFLCIKNNLPISKKRSVVRILGSIDHGNPSDRQLFTFIPCGCPVCAGVCTVFCLA